MALRVEQSSSLDEAQQSASSSVLSDSVSLGVDIVEIDRMRTILKRSPTFARRAFSSEEQAYCNATAAPEFHYATRFAAKEAVLKALGTGFSQGIGMKDVEVALDAKGKPRAVLHGRALELSKEKNIEELPLSLSYTHKEAVACAMALSGKAKSEPIRKMSPTEELTRQFKEVRSLLDDIPSNS